MIRVTGEVTVERLPIYHRDKQALMLTFMSTGNLKMSGFKGEHYGKGRWTQTHIIRGQEAALRGTKGEL